MSTYSIGDAARILKVSPARLRYWERTALLQPQAKQGEMQGEQGGERPEKPGAQGKKAESGGALEFRDLVCVRGILSLLEQGVPLRRIRRNVEILRDRLPELDDPLRSLRVWVEGSERMVIRHDGVLLEPSGQMVLDFGGESLQCDAVTPIEPEESERDAAIEAFERGCLLDSDPETFDAAMAAYQQALELEPDFADCHCNLGAVHYNRGDRAAARRCFERCLEAEKDHVEGHFNLANLLEEEGCDEMALHHYRSALAADPLYPDLQINLALIHEKLGDRAQAVRHWRRYLQLDPEGAWATVARQRLERDI